MFIDIRNLQERRNQRDSQFEGTRDIRNGYLFEVNGSVEGDRDGMVWFKALDGNSEPFQVFYNGIIGDLRANMYVKIERKPKDPSRWQISDFDTGIYFDDQSTYEQLPSTSAIPKKEDYEWPPGFPGAKALNIFPRAITDFAVRPTSPTSMKARVYSGIYPGATNYARFQGPVNTKDFTADVPGAGLARLAAISIDNTGTLNYTNGTTFVGGLPMPDASLPAVPASQMLISAIRLVNGMTAIEESNFDLEMRPLMANSTVNVKVNEVWEKDFGAPAIVTDNNGNVGAGTAVPTDNLQVEAASGITAIASVFTGGQFVELRAGGVGSSFGYKDSGDFNIGMVSDLGEAGLDTSVMTFDTAADIGIGISAGIAAQLHIDQSDSGGIQPVLKLDQGDASEECILYSGDGADQDIILDKVDVTGLPTRFWDESEDAFSWNKGLRVTSGRVAIGNISPDTPLHVYTGDASVVANALTLITAEHSGAAAISILTGATNSGFLMFGDTGDSFIGGIRYFHNDDSMRFQVNDTEYVIIDSSGKVGIGTTGPAAQLHIDQPSTTAAIPVITADQADLSEEFINFVSTIGAGNPIDTAAIGTYYGKTRVAVNGTFKYMALYNS